jgi:translation initiation factor IF-2
MTAIAGVRVSDLARELKKTPAEMMADLIDLGVKAAGPTATIDSETANMVREMLNKSASSGKVAEVGPHPTVQEVADAMGVAANDAVKKLIAMGELVAARQRIKPDLAARLAAAYGFTLVPKPEVRPAAPGVPANGTKSANGAVLEAPPAPKPTPKPKPVPGVLPARPPVVTIMGHVDHGKTSLLDMIRKTKVVEGEFGGITQHIGAYQVEIDYNGEKRKITFLDTPGHAAFTEMRARGASVTDIVILVVAADDGIMPQTVEAINHAQAAHVPIIVAMNKMDKPDAMPDRIKQQLTEHNIVVEDYGGDVPALPVSAKTGDGINNLLEYIILVADTIVEPKADPSGNAKGAIIEAKVLPGRGPVATILVQSGTLRVGDNLVAGATYGKVRAMTNERGERLQKAGPSTPVEVSGLNNAPAAGDQVEVIKSDREARALAEDRALKVRDTRMSATTKRMTLADFSRQAAIGTVKDLNLIVKGDVQGSVEAVVGQLNKLEENKKEVEVRINIKYSDVGSISEADVIYAETTGSTILGFNVRPDIAAQKAADRDGVNIRQFNIIYDLTEYVDRAMKDMLTPIYEEAPLGKAEVRQTFRTPKGIIIAGSFVTEGKLVRGAEVRVRRGKEAIFTGKIDTLRRIKDDAREVAQGYECGVVVQDFLDVKEGDVLECFEMRIVPRA